MKIPLLDAFRRAGGNIDALYGAIVAQARNPGFYRDWGVPDTIEGRLEMIILHLTLVLDRLATEAAPMRDIGQRVFDHFCQDMDDHYREMGVGDLTVPKKMRRVADAFYGRFAAYRAAFSDPVALQAALMRNVTPSSESAATQLAGYVRYAVTFLAEQEPKAIAQGRLAWPEFGAISPAQYGHSAEGVQR